MSLVKQVLIADTNAQVRERLYERLLEAEIHSDCVSTAPDAMEKLDANPYAVLVADVGLPDGGIDHVIAKVSRLERARRPIVLVLAATAEAGRSLDVDVVQIVLRRPVEISKVVDLIRSCLSSASSGRRPKEDGERAGHATS